LFAACTGDTRGFLFSSDSAVEMNDDAKKRALGHLRYKQTDEENETKLSPIPCVKSFQITDKTNFFVIGTWTFWVAMSADTVRTVVTEELGKRDPSQPLEPAIQNLARDLVFKASSLNAEPNISCVVGMFEHNQSNNLIIKDI